VLRPSVKERFLLEKISPLGEIMSFETVAQNLTPEIYHRLKDSLQLGKWPDGKALSREQKEICMEAIISYEIANHIPEAERVGYLNRDRPTACASGTDDRAGNDKTGNDEQSWSVIRVGKP
jgi:uncharacterized protein YeaC (DUF1315 family)